MGQWRCGDGPPVEQGKWEARGILSSQQPQARGGRPGYVFLSSLHPGQSQRAKDVCVNVCRCVSMACMRMRVCTCSDMHVFGQRPQACSKQMIVKMSNDMEDCVNQFVVCTSTRRCSIHIAGCRMQVPGHPEPVLKFCRR